MEQIENPQVLSLFSDFVLNPAKIQADDTRNLVALLEEFPYCQILHACLCRANLLATAGSFVPTLTRAALQVPDRNILHMVVHHADTLERFETQDYSGLRVKPEPKMLEFYEADLDTIPEVEVIVDSIEVEETSVESSVLEALDLDEDSIVELPEAHLFASDALNVAHKVTKYDDDTLPYSFLWWLNKIRNNHAGVYTYQPYIKLQPETITHSPKGNQVDGLDQQIVEHIFHQVPPLVQLESQGAITFKRKEEAILDKFIQEDPQIKPPQPGNLTTENKARQSAQDLNDLVSETLARIYTRQMLLDKAIDTYKKLSLRFPEKSAYFTHLIHALEEKLNK